MWHSICVSKSTHIVKIQIFIKIFITSTKVLLINVRFTDFRCTKMIKISILLRNTLWLLFWMTLIDLESYLNKLTKWWETKFFFFENKKRSKCVENKDTVASFSILQTWKICIRTYYIYSLCNFISQRDLYDCSKL